MVHLSALPGSPGFGGSRVVLRDAALRDAETLVSAGVHGLLVENFHDTPFTAGRVPAWVVAEMTVIVTALCERFDVPVGVNVLRNDARSALAVASAAGAGFIRVNVLCGARLTDQGLIEGEAYSLLRERTLLGAGEIAVLADVNVKHSSPLGPPRPIEEEAADTLARGGADALIVSGAGTGAPADTDELRRVKAAAGVAPVLVGSGVTPDNVGAYAPHADGFIVGTSLKHAGVAANPVDPQRVRALLTAVRAAAGG